MVLSCRLEVQSITKVQRKGRKINRLRRESRYSIEGKKAVPGSEGRIG